MNIVKYEFAAARQLLPEWPETAFAVRRLPDEQGPGNVLLLPFALAGGSFTTVKPGRHALTACDIIERFTGRRWTFEQQPNGCHQAQETTR